MIQLKRAEEHYRTDAGWLTSYHHFSFDEYYDPANMNFFSLRVFNDDTIAPASGFPLHPHRDMEILTYVIRGELAHEDSMGNKGKIGPGEVQIMSAGTGVLHAEFNASQKNDLHLLQMWVTPQKNGLKPRWEQKAFPVSEKKDALLRIASQHPLKNELKIFADAAFCASVLKKGKKTEWKPANEERKQYVFVIDGTLRVNDKTLHPRDVAMCAGEEKIVFEAREHAHFVMWDVGGTQ